MRTGTWRGFKGLQVRGGQTGGTLCLLLQPEEKIASQFIHQAPLCKFLFEERFPWPKEKINLCTKWLQVPALWFCTMYFIRFWKDLLVGRDILNSWQEVVMEIEGEMIFLLNSYHSKWDTNSVNSWIFLKRHIITFLYFLCWFKNREQFFYGRTEIYTLLDLDQNFKIDQNSNWKEKNLL